MTAPESTPVSTEPPADIPPEADAGPADYSTDDPADANKEAAKYRRALREAEAQRDTMTGRLEALQRREVERIAGATLAKPEALWAAGAELAQMLDADGNVDAAAVTQATVTAAESLGLARPPSTPLPDRSQGPRAMPEVEPQHRWTDLLSGSGGPPA